MGFFNDLGKKVADASQSTFEKGKDMVEITKLKSSISDEQKKIVKVYEEMGKHYFETFKDNPGESFVSFFESVRDSENKIEDYKKQIEAVKAD